MAAYYDFVAYPINEKQADELTDELFVWLRKNTRRLCWEVDFAKTAHHGSTLNGQIYWEKGIVPITKDELQLLSLWFTDKNLFVQIKAQYHDNRECSA